jgi:hypothetical protein
MTPIIAGHTLAAGDIVVDEHGRRYRLVGRWGRAGWEALAMSGPWAVLISDEALAATSPDRNWWWDS